MKVLLVGRGGRESALAWRLSRSPSLSSLLVTGIHPGWPGLARVRPATGKDDIVALAQEERVDLVVVGPEAPLAEGLADACIAVGIPCFGPTAAAARLEASKAFAKQVMVEAGVPTAGYLVVQAADPASILRGRERAARGSVVVKADGLAAGKGVVVCTSASEAEHALQAALDGRFGAAAERIVLEDLLTGPEVSVFGLCDGVRVVGLPSAQDHKALLDGGFGPNTGGMGAYAPCPLLSADGVEQVLDQVHRPVVAKMVERGTPFCGVLFAGLMMTPDGPRVLEFNVRFGDPECQALMPLWQDDPLPWLYGAARGTLPAGVPTFTGRSACCVVLAGRGYPERSDRGTPIPEPPPLPGVEVFHAGTRRTDDGDLVTDGGRVLGITGFGASLHEARERAYTALRGWTFPGAQYRTDIGAGGLNPQET